MKTTPRIITALAIAGAFVTTAVQAAESGPYIRLENGVNSISGAKLKVAIPGLPVGIEGKAKLDSSYIYGGAVGYSFGSFAAEVALDYSEAKLKSVAGVDVTNPNGWDIPGGIKFNQTTLLANAIYKLPVAESLSLDLSGGLGARFQSTKFTEEPGIKQKSDTAFVAQLSPSLSFSLSKNLSLNAGYKLRFVDETGLAHVQAPNTDVKLTSHWDHVFTVGVGFNF